MTEHTDESRDLTKPGQADTEILADRGRGGQDMALVRRALKEGWPVSAEMKKTIVERGLELIMQDRDIRASATAMETLRRMCSDNLELDKFNSEVNGSSVTESVTVKRTYRVRFDGDG